MDSVPAWMVDRTQIPPPSPPPHTHFLLPSSPNTQPHTSNSAQTTPHSTPTNTLSHHSPTSNTYHTCIPSPRTKSSTILLEAVAHIHSGTILF
jgi:hypothetical protein